MLRLLLVLCFTGCASEVCEEVPVNQNGRFPQTRSVTVQGDTIWLGVTFGALVSKAGSPFRWVCETAIGYGGTFDPQYAFTQDGALLATTFNGLQISRDGGCVFDPAPAPLSDHWTEAMAVDTTGRIIVGTASSNLPNDVFRSSDNALTFVSLGLSDPQMWYKSLVAAESNPQTIYVSGYTVSATLPDGGFAPPTVALFRTLDDGQTWDSLDLSTIEQAADPGLQIMGISKTDDSVVYLRSINANPPLGDVLYRSADAGVTWSEVLRTDTSITAMTIDENGTFFLGVTEEGIYASSEGQTFSLIPESPRGTCLQSTPGKLYACGSNWDPDFAALASSTNGGVSFDSEFRFIDMQGPKLCPSDSPQFTCAVEDWPDLAMQFGIGAVDQEISVICSKDPGCRAQNSSSVILMFMVTFLMMRRQR